jgi:UDP-glucuronate 4-epimerase
MGHKILVTGAAGFIGFHVSKELLAQGHQLIGLDNINDYYDVSIKYARLEQLQSHPDFSFVKEDLSNKAAIDSLFAEHKFDFVVNLAAQAGVRYSLTNPDVYIDSNIKGFLNILEGCRHNQVKHLVYASSSSVYGLNTRMPFSVSDNVDHPVSLYAATKKSNELMAHSYSHLYAIPTTGLRFFTVYGPWGRPDMAYFMFTKAILENKPIKVFNQGKMQRDFTYIDDIVQGVIKTLFNIPAPNSAWDSYTSDPAFSSAPYRIYNIGNNNPVELSEMISLLERALDRTAVKTFLPMQGGDVPSTYANIDDIRMAVGFEPTTSLERGIYKFVDWYRSFFNVKINE